MGEGSLSHLHALHAVTRSDRADGSIVLGSGLKTGPVARNTGEWLDRFAKEAPDRVFLAERSGEGWREVAYGEMRQQVRAVAAVLLARGLGPERPIMVLSGPGVDHGVLALAAQYAGIPLAPIAEQYSLIAGAHPRLEYIAQKVRPAMVFADDAGPFGPAMALDAFAGAIKFASRGASGAIAPFAELLKGGDARALDAAHAKVGPETLAKILFTSGSTSHPKGVPQTQRMLCVNQAQYLACLPLLAARPPKILDWLPWNHVFAGNSNFNMVLANGGSLYLDNGKPTKALFAHSVRNIREHAGTLSLNVPIAFAMLVEAMRGDKELRKRYFADLDMIFYAGASLPQDVWQALEEMAVAERGAIPLMTSSWGMTETAPCAVLNYVAGAQSGMIGVPVPGLEAKLLPVGEQRYELRVRGPNVMREYYREPDKTAESFDEEGFFLTGDAVRFADDSDFRRGLRFDGRISEDFKLMTGTWVQAGALRLAALKALHGLVQDVVVTGHDRADLGLLVFPDPAGYLSQEGAVVDAAYLAKIRERLAALAASSTGSSTRLSRALAMAEPPSAADGEITAKGSLNIRTVLTRREKLLARLYRGADAAVVTV
jgi:feruloyl-CoA synthase